MTTRRRVYARAAAVLEWLEYRHAISEQQRDAICDRVWSLVFAR